MINELSGVTGYVARAALDALSVQQSVRSSNIANVNTENYRAASFEFSSMLNEIMKTASVGNLHDVKSELMHFAETASTIEELYVVGDSPVELDNELLEMNKIALQYRALLTGLNLYGGIMDMAINGGSSK